jgi:2-keto-4-pentenoate hydratase
MTTTNSLIDAFWRARQQGTYFPPDYFGKLSIDQAYEVQLGLIERRCAAGERQIEARVTINDHPVAIGTGDAVLGNPLNSVVWLAAKLGAYGRRLKAGEIVMTGSFTKQFPIAPGDRIETVFSGLGAVRTAMSA